MTNTTEVQRTTAAILDRLRDSGEPFIPTRYPFTYAYDFARNHADDFDFPHYLSRAETSAWVTHYADITGQDRGDVVVALADGYIAQWNVKVTDEQKADALAHQRLVSWKSFGLSAPPAI